MKVLLANKYFFINGGSELVFFKERDFLLQQGHKVVDFAMADKRNFQSDFSSYFAPHIDFHSSPNAYNRIKQAVSFIHSSASVNSIEALIKKEKPEIAHLHNIYHQLTPSIIPVLKKHGVKVIMTLHDYKLICPSYLAIDGRSHSACTDCKGKHFYKPILRRCQNSRSQELLFSLEAYWHKWRKNYEKIDFFITPSQFLLDLVSQRIPESKIRIIYNGINTDEYQPNYADAGYILYLGRLTYEKGITVLLEAYSKLSKTHDFPLKIVGTGPLKKELARTYPGADFCGYKSGNELKELIEKAAMVVVPSTSYENCSMVILEAMAMGKPVIATNIGGIPEQIDDGKTGFLFEPKDVDGLVDKMGTLLGDPVMRHSMGEKARRKIEEKYSLNGHCQNLLSLYASLLH